MALLHAPSPGPLPMHLRLAVRVQQLQQPLAHQESRLVRGHVALNAVADIDAHVVLGRFEDGPVLVHNRPVPGNELRRGAICLSIVASHWHSCMVRSSIGVAIAGARWERSRERPAWTAETTCSGDAVS